MDKGSHFNRGLFVRELAQDYLNQGDPLGWFNKLYTEAEDDLSTIPWAHLCPNAYVTSWVESRKPEGKGERAVVVGCGLGDDAEFLADVGFDVTAFDISPKAINGCRSRFPGSRVNYQVSNLLRSPPAWTMAFDFVLEVYTLQALPRSLRTKAIPHIARLVAAGGTLLLITRARNEHDDPGNLPWPLTRQEVDVFQSYDLSEKFFEDFVDNGDPPVRRFRIEYARREPH